MNKTFHIPDAELELAASEQPTATPMETIEEHIADCQQCQLRLLELSADSDWRNELSDELGTVFRFSSLTTDGNSNSACAPESRAPAGDEFDLQTVDQMLNEVLAPPTHPETRGRLGRYEVESVLGCGGMGVVMRGFDRELHRPVAIKMVLPRLAGNGTAKQRFLREARAAATVLHPNVIGIHDIDESGGVPWFVMPLIAGPSLKTLVENNGPLNEREVVRIGLQIAGGLAAAHSQGLVHRDIKPENILVDNQVNRVVITDFGLARRESEEAMTQTGMLAGTLNYMSPEQSRGEDIDGRSDLFSLGGVLYFLATGVAPFQSSVAMRVLHKVRNDGHTCVRSLNPEISASLSNTIDGLLAKSPDHRIQLATELESYLNDYLAHLHHPTRQPAPAAPVMRNRAPVTRHWTGKLSVAIVALLCLGLLSLWITGNWPAVSKPEPEPASASAAMQWSTIKSQYQLDDRGVFLSELKKLGEEFQAIEHSLNRLDPIPSFAEPAMPQAQGGTLERDLLELGRQFNQSPEFFEGQLKSQDSTAEPGFLK